MLYVIHVNVYSILVLLLILFSIHRNQRPGDQNDPFFELLILLVIVNLALDIPNEILQGREGSLITILLVLGNSLAYVLNVVTTMFWVFHVDDFLFKDPKRTKKYMPFIMIPLGIMIILVTINIFSPFLFVVTEDNIYQRGPLFMLSPMILYGYVFYSLGYIIYHSNRIKKEDLFPLLMFPIFPLIGGTVQVLFYGALTVWPSAALSFLSSHLTLQSKLIQVDSLTGLYNKREFSRKIETLKPSRFTSGQLAGVIIDIDQFKEINDEYGHDMGDHVLKALSDIMKKSFRNNDFVARLGGDEFAVLMEIDHQDMFDEIIDTFKKGIEVFNKSGLLPVEFDVSIGARIFNVKNDGNIAMFIQELDRAMYAQKKR